MKPRDELAVIVAGSVSANEFLLLDADRIVGELTLDPIATGGFNYQTGIDMRGDSPDAVNQLAWSTEVFGTATVSRVGLSSLTAPALTPRSAITATSYRDTGTPSSNRAQTFITAEQADGSSIRTDMQVSSYTDSSIWQADTYFQGVSRRFGSLRLRSDISGTALTVTAELRVAPGPTPISIGNLAPHGNYGTIQSPHADIIMGQDGVDGALYLRTRAAWNVNIGANNSNTLVVGNGSTTANGNLTITGAASTGGNMTVGNTLSVASTGQVNGILVASIDTNGSVWTGMGVRIESAGTECGLAMWNQAGGVAPVLRQFNGHGEAIDCGNNPGTGYAPLGASAFIVRSSAQWKRNIRRPDDRERTARRAAFGQLRTAVWDDLDPEYKLARTPRFADINRRWIARGHAPLAKVRHLVEPVEHDCEQNDCAGNAADPCGLVRRHRGRRGFIAEELVEWLPEAVQLDDQNRPIGVDYGTITTELVEVVQDLVAEVAELRDQLGLTSNP